VTGRRFLRRTGFVPIKNRPPGENRAPSACIVSPDALATVDSTLGIHSSDLPTDGLPAECTVPFTFLWLDEKRWEGVNVELAIGRSEG
jgi:hypothetical protein